jgi:hypothetical protein
MAVMARSLDDVESWQIVYDTEARRLYVECPADGEPKQFSVNDSWLRIAGSKRRTS